MEGTPAAAAAPPARIARPGRRPVAVLVLGIVALATGFLAITLLLAVIAIVLASLELQDLSAGRGDPARRGRTVAGMVCGIVALCIWIPVVVAVAVAEG